MAVSAALTINETNSRKRQDQHHPERQQSGTQQRQNAAAPRSWLRAPDLIETVFHLGECSGGANQQRRSCEHGRQHSAVFITSIAQKLLHEPCARVADQLSELSNECAGRGFCPEHRAGDRDCNHQDGRYGKDGIERQSRTATGAPVVQPAADGICQKG
jgi:hypothetical protein